MEQKVKITWLGTAAIRLEADGETVLFDPFVQLIGGENPNCLDDFFHLCRPHFIQKQCENNWCREAYQQCVKVQQQYISHQSPEIHPCEKLDKVLKSDKFTPYKPEI